IGLLATVALAPGGGAGLAWQFAAVGTGAGVTVLLLQLADAYHIPSLRSASRNSKRILVSGLVGVLLSAVALYLMSGRAFGLPGYLIWLAGTELFLLVERHLVASGIRHWARNGLMERRAVIVGGAELARQFVRARAPQSGKYRPICGLYEGQGVEFYSMMRPG